MRIPYSWLKDYVKLELGPEELAHELTMHGLEVDRIDYGWPDIVTAEIVWLQKVKGSDHLSATRVTTGTEEFSVVCGAPNIKLHDRVPLAKVGAKVGDITIQPKKAMGVLSEGMLCSPRELGISDDHQGILILPPETPLGVPLGKIIGEAVIDLDIKAHRGDLFCIVGVAREVAAFTGQKLRPPKIAVKEKGTPTSDLMKLEVRDANLCPRYTARVVRDVKIGPSPEWMQDRLTLAGMRPINNVVDITNYVMLELGQPLHAFDYDKVAEHTIIVRRAEPGETLTTLDGVTRHLTSEMQLITDPAGPNVIAGIFGGERVEVSAATTSVLLEAAHFNPVNVRRTSVALALRTESSGRFEKNPDIELTAVAIDRSAQLLTELAGGTVARGRVDFYPNPIAERRIAFKPSLVEWLTGMPVTRNEVLASLRALGFGVAEPPDGADDVLDVTVPTWRGDVEEGADLVEEVARIVGYDRIASTIPVGPLPEPLRDSWPEREHRVREILVGAGLTEAVNYTLTSRAAMAKLLLGTQPGEELLLTAPVAGQTAMSAPLSVGQTFLSVSEEQPTTPESSRTSERRQIEAIAAKLPAITLANPLSVDLEALRLTLMSGLLGVVRENAKHTDTGLWFFEIGRRYIPTPALADGDGLPQERRTLGVAISGPLARGWLGEERDADFFDLKGIAETLLHALKVSDYRFTPTRTPTFHPGRCALLEVAVATPADGSAILGGRAVTADDARRWVATAVLGEVHPEVAERFDLPKRTYLMELDLERLFPAVPAVVPYTPIARYPAAQRDLAVVVGAATPQADVAGVIRASGGALLRQVSLFDVYTGQGIPEGKKSLAYTLTYQSTERTLTDAEIEAAQSAIIAALKQQLGAALRG
ncbi:MAG: Phenylalanyl-tRNA synthetase beta chain [Ktedonobacterales bacterium]|jgi:phenylalanyl-tRNA synthetase beta chain|nr:MAG: Phenylalanyl-tRNA synthetase beta chain [Ktedonobacterales bacterium]